MHNSYYGQILTNIKNALSLELPQIELDLPQRYRPTTIKGDTSYFIAPVKVTLDNKVNISQLN